MNVLSYSINKTKAIDMDAWKEENSQDIIYESPLDVRTATIQEYIRSIFIKITEKTVEKESR